MNFEKKQNIPRNVIRVIRKYKISGRATARYTIDTNRSYFMYMFQGYVPSVFCAGSTGINRIIFTVVSCIVPLNTLPVTVTRRSLELAGDATSLFFGTQRSGAASPVRKLLHITRTYAYY